MLATMLGNSSLDPSKASLFTFYRYSIDAVQSCASQFELVEYILFNNPTLKKVSGKAREWLPALRRFLLILIVLMCFMIRLFAVIRFESMIHEFDPYFNFRTTLYLKTHGFYEFWNWFDDVSWYPLGRVVGQTLYPGLMTTAMTVSKTLQLFGITLSIKHICVFMGPVFGGFCGLASYFFAREVTGSEGAGLFAAFFTGICPSFLSRSVAGSYDNECVAIFAMVFAFYTWVRALRVGTLLSAIYASFATFYMVNTWGAYVFVINTIAVHIVVLALLDRLTVKHHVVYCVYYVLVTMLCLNVPFVNFSAIFSSEHMSLHGVFVFINALLAVSHLRSVVPRESFNKWLSYLVATAVGLFLLVFCALTVMGKTSWSGRSLTLLDPSYASKYIPIIASVAEHQAPVWSAYIFDLHLGLFLAPCGLWLCLKKRYPGLLFLAIYGLLAVYFSGVMVRLMLVLSPAISMLAGIAASYIVENLMQVLRLSSLNAHVNYIKHTKSKVATGFRKHFSPWVALCSLFALAYLCILYGSHCTWTSSVAYSHPTIVSRIQSADGSLRLQDDFREAYSWFKENTDPKARIMCWWDYGYQTTAMANRTVLVDNNTWNNTHIATVGLAFASNEEDAYQVIRKLDVDYVFVVFGGYVGYHSDDVNKFLWMVRIASGVFPIIQQSNYLTARSHYSVGSDAPDALLNSLLYKLCYYNFHKLRNGNDAARNYQIGRFVDTLDHFEEVYTTSNWVVRIYKVKRPPNRDAHYQLKASTSMQRSFTDFKS